MNLLRPLIIFAALLFGSIMAEAQPTPLNNQGIVYNSFTPYGGTNVVTLSLSAASSGNAALGITSPVNTPSVAWVQNTGSNPANVILGVGNTLTASLTTGTYLGAGTCMALNSIGATYIAGYSTSGTTLVVTMGVGNPAGSCGGASAGGGGGGTSSTFGAAFPSTGTAVGMSQGGNMVALTGTSGNLNVQCANCTGSGVSATDEAAFTAGSSLFAPGGGFYQTTATSNPLTTGQQGAFQVTANRALFTNLRNAAGTEVGTAGAPLQVSVANTAANGTAILVTGTGGTFPVTAASGAFASGSLASGAMVDLVAAETPVAPNTATATKGLLVSGTFTTTQPTLTTTQQAALAFTSRNAVIVAPGVDNFAVQATLQASATTAIGKVDPNTIATWGLAATTQNVAAPTNGMAVLAEFTTTPTTITSGNFSPLQMDNAGNLLVNIKAGAGSGGTAIADNAAFTQSTTNETPMGCLYNTSYATPTSGHSTIPQCDSSGRLIVNVATATGIAQGATYTSQTFSPVMGLASTNAPTATTGDLWALSISPASGGVRIDLKDTAANTNAFLVQGDVASGASNSGNPLQAGGRAENAEPTAVTNGQRVGAAFDLVGRQIVFPMANKENLVSGVTAAMTGTTSTQVIAGVASTKLYITSVSCGNSHATVGTFVNIQDGSGGTTIATLACGAVYGGDEKNGGGIPLFSTTAGNGLYAADVTTGANVIVNASGFKGT